MSVGPVTRWVCGFAFSIFILALAGDLVWADWPRPTLTLLREAPKPRSRCDRFLRFIAGAPTPADVLSAIVQDIEYNRRALVREVLETEAAKELRAKHEVVMGPLNMRQQAQRLKLLALQHYRRASMIEDEALDSFYERSFLAQQLTEFGLDAFSSWLFSAFVRTDAVRKNASFTDLAQQFALADQNFAPITRFDDPDGAMGVILRHLSAPKTKRHRQRITYPNTHDFFRALSLEGYVLDPKFWPARVQLQSEGDAHGPVLLVAPQAFFNDWSPHSKELSTQRTLAIAWPTARDSYIDGLEEYVPDLDAIDHKLQQRFLQIRRTLKAKGRLDLVRFDVQSYRPDTEDFSGPEYRHHTIYLIEGVVDNRTYLRSYLRTLKSIHQLMPSASGEER